MSRMHTDYKGMQKFWSPMHLIPSCVGFCMPISQDTSTNGLHPPVWQSILKLVWIWALLPSRNNIFKSSQNMFHYLQTGLIHINIVPYYKLRELIINRVECREWYQAWQKTRSLKFFYVREAVWHWICCVTTWQTNVRGKSYRWMEQ